MLIASAIDLETANAATAGMSASQVVGLIIIGMILAALLVALMMWLIEINNRPLKKLPDKIDELVAQLLRLEGKLWNKDDIDQAIAVKITEHNENKDAHSVQKVRRI